MLETPGNNVLELVRPALPTTGHLYPDNVIHCANVFFYGPCANGVHKHIKVAGCGREWCRDCGNKLSMVHCRRIARYYDKIQTMHSVGYAVVTIPEELIDRYRCKEELKALRDYLSDKFKRTEIGGTATKRVTIYKKNVISRGKSYVKEYKRTTYVGYDRGLSRWHWAGDCKECRGKGCIFCQSTGADTTYRPHLNFILPAGYILPHILDKFKRDLGAWFSRRFSLDYVPTVVLNYSYTTNKKKKSHILRYVTRATWRFYDFDICNIVRGQRSILWGKWPKSKQPCKSDTVLLEKNICSHCLHDTGEMVKILWKRRLMRAEAIPLMKLMKEVEKEGKHTAATGHFVGGADIVTIFESRCNKSSGTDP